MHSLAGVSLALRVSLGADAKAIVFQLLVETLFLFVCGAVLGIVCALWSQRALVYLLPPDLPRLEEIHLNWPVLVLSFAVSLALGLIFGLLPGLNAIRTDLAQHLNDGSRSHTTGSAAGRIRQVLVIGQLALAFVLLTAAGLLLRRFSSVLESARRPTNRQGSSVRMPCPKSNTHRYRTNRRSIANCPAASGSTAGVVSVSFGTEVISKTNPADSSRATGSGKS